MDQESADPLSALPAPAEPKTCRRPRSRNAARERHQKLAKRYGIGLTDFERLLTHQAGACAICRREELPGKPRFAVDHDHGTGSVRGILCAPCNRALGLFGDSSEIVRRAAAYLLTPPAYACSPALDQNPHDTADRSAEARCRVLGPAPF